MLLMKTEHAQQSLSTDNSPLIHSVLQAHNTDTSLEYNTSQICFTSSTLCSFSAEPPFTLRHPIFSLAVIRNTPTCCSKTVQFLLFAGFIQRLSHFLNFYTISVSTGYTQNVPSLSGKGRFWSPSHQRLCSWRWRWQGPPNLW